MNTYDVAVVGAGPAGITAALYLGRSGCSVLLYEQLSPGGQILLTETLENYPGFPNGIKGYELADLFAEHLQNIPNIKRPKGEVTSIRGSAGRFSILSSRGSEEHLARSVIVCCGSRHRHLGLEDEDRLVGHGVSYCALCDGNFYRGKPVAVAGGGNSALEETLYLAKLVDKVHLIHRRQEFRGNKIYQDRIKEQKDRIIVHLNSVITKLNGKEYLESLIINNVKTGQDETIPVEALFIYVGFAPDTAFLPPQVARDNNGFIITDTEMRTNIPGIFAAGDIRSKLCRQVITAAGDGAAAAQCAFIFLEQLNA